MSNHDELIKRLRASAAAMPFDAAVAVQYRAAADALEAQAREIEGLRKDAERYRAFIDCGQPICFLGYEYFGKEALDAAIDAAKAGRARLEGKP